MYQKDFNSWNEAKKKIESHDTKNLYFKEREIWWASVGVNIGSESDGKNQLFERPVLVLKKLGSGVFLGAPITSKVKEGPFFVAIGYSNRVGTVLLTDIRSFSVKRLVRKMTVVSDTEFIKVSLVINKLLE